MDNNKSPLMISSIKILPTTGYCSTNSCDRIYPYNHFDIEIELQVYDFIALTSDAYIMFKYPHDIINGKNVKVESQSLLPAGSKVVNPLLGVLKANSNALQMGVGGDKGELTLLNVAEDLIVERKFKLILRQWSAFDNNTLENRNFEVFVYWKNTYSIFSYHALSAITITRAFINYPPNSSGLTGINHPEYWDIYANGAWPMQFTFQFDNQLQNGGYLLIRQTNTQTGISEFNFISSTCDFSLNNKLQIDSTYGQRPICYPLNNAFKTSTSNNTFPGSGVFF